VKERVPKEKALPFEPLSPNAKTDRAMKDLIANLHAKD
jgi:antitoxin component of RelBE/YafQ-DinJ toxin-antitoxin module